MTTEDILMEACEPDTGLINLGKYDHDVLRELLAKAHQAGIDDAVEIVTQKKQDFTDHICRFNDSPQRCECYEKALDDTIKSLQDKK